MKTTNQNITSGMMLKGVDVLKYLMEEHHLNQNDLPEIGSQGVVSEILNGKRKLNVKSDPKIERPF